jgi:hypothetical protein
LLERGSMTNLADDVCAVRLHADQMTLQSIRTGTLIDENIVLFEEYGRKPYVRKSVINMASRKFEWLAGFGFAGII